eukprot:30948-Pelagococcus_subviridis.AAC.4
MAFTAGVCRSAFDAALMKHDMNPSFTPCVSVNASLYSARIAIRLDMLISLNVVSIAYVFCADLRRSLRTVPYEAMSGWS